MLIYQINNTFLKPFMSITICESIKFARLKNTFDKSSNLIYKNTTFVFLKSTFDKQNRIYKDCNSEIQLVWQ